MSQRKKCYVKWIDLVIENPNLNQFRNVKHQIFIVSAVIKYKNFPPLPLSLILKKQTTVKISSFQATLNCQLQ